MVSDDSALDGVVSGEHGLLGALERDAIHVAMSTVEPATARRLADAHYRHGARYVAAPVFGRPETAEQAKLWVIAAGAGDAVETCLPLLKALSRGISRVGKNRGGGIWLNSRETSWPLPCLGRLGGVSAYVEKAG